MNNKKNFFKKKTINKILNIAKKNKIFYLDTARTYNNVEKVLGNFNLDKFKIITKIKNIKLNKNIYNFIQNDILKSIYDLRIKNFYGLLIHNPNDLRKKRGKEIYNCLLNLKRKGLIKKIGYSINSPNDLNYLYKKFKPDLIQTPLNVFDQRIIHSGWIKKLKKDKVEIHARSIFLQGLLLRRRGNLPKQFYKFKNTFDKWHKWLDKNNSSALNACLNFVCSKNEIKKIIFGIDNTKQLNDILSIKKNNFLNYTNLYSNNTNLIMPNKWRIK